MGIPVRYRGGALLGGEAAAGTILAVFDAGSTALLVLGKPAVADFLYMVQTFASSGSVPKV